MSHCTKPGCKLARWRKGLCYTHWRERQGFIFNHALKRFIREAPRSRSRRSSAA